MLLLQRQNEIIDLQSETDKLRNENSLLSEKVSNVTYVCVLTTVVYSNTALVVV